MNYICKYGLYHDRPCSLFPSSNNGWIYSSYAQALGLPVDDLSNVYAACYLSAQGSFLINRLPGKRTPPMSRDEVIGLTSLGFGELFMKNNFYFYKHEKQVNLWKTLKALWSLRGEHRNHVWEYEVRDAYPVVFKLWFHDIYYVKKINFQKTSVFEWFFFNLYCFSTIIQNNTSAKNVCWLQLKDLKSKFWIKFIDQKKNFLEYFGKDHPFTNC